ncbi:hypothetical protein FDI40_gp553 [Agrobacterium phage Atu_ph07]|uniref:Uncharacterized protein n=1 Tax=Agrobacterium phage Atu_ph07 TaxID=2024264 RepID=A0A2L0V0F8_9CAUD|nr:hypothetical protein FDI40_gp553 [Agrobacterium phage Atu_ph07]AUZ95312.1 hypothetical protein [Agrobacterium phage Atu_ph07]
MFMREDNNVYEKDIRSIITYEMESGIENRVYDAISRLSSLVELLLSKGIITEEEVYDIAEIPANRRFYTTLNNYDIQYTKNSKYELLKYTIDPDNNSWEIPVIKHVITTGNYAEVKTAKETLEDDQKYK